MLYDCNSVLGTLVKNKVVPDPFYGLQNEAIIDIADSGREYYTFWFFTTFQCKLVGDIQQYLHNVRYESFFCYYANVCSW